MTDLLKWFTKYLSVCVFKYRLIQGVHVRNPITSIGRQIQMSFILEDSYVRFCENLVVVMWTLAFGSVFCAVFVLALFILFQTCSTFLLSLLQASVTSGVCCELVFSVFLIWCRTQVTSSHLLTYRWTPLPLMGFHTFSHAPDTYAQATGWFYILESTKVS